MAIPTVNTAGIWNRLAYQGDTHVWSFTVLDGAGDPVDLSGTVVTMTIKYARGASVAALWSGSTTGGQITATALGVVTVTIPDTDMGDLPGGALVYDVQFAEGGVVQTYLTGQFTVTTEVTP